MVPTANAGTNLEADASYLMTVVEPPCDLSALPIGGVCDDGTRNVVYIGQLSGARLYTTTIELAPSSFSTAAILTDAVSRTNGMENTNKLLARTDATYPMAQSCRSLGAKWYLPGIDELSVLFTNKAAVISAAGMSLYDYVDVYYSSSDYSATYAYHLNMLTSSPP